MDRARRSFDPAPTSGEWHGGGLEIEYVDEGPNVRPNVYRLRRGRGPVRDALARARRRRR